MPQLRHARVQVLFVTERNPMKTFRLQGALMALAIARAAGVDAAFADDTTVDAASDQTAGGKGTVETIVITAQRLNDRRAGIATQIGADTYTIDQAAILAAPGADNTLFNQVILQAPDVVQDSFGQFHVRGEHNDLQYRLNGIILPEGISVFGQSSIRG